MKSLTLFFLLSGVLIFHISAHAEGNCPLGYYSVGGQGVQGCAPIPDYDQQEPSQALVAPPPKWKSRWGAIAIDGTAGSVGMVTNLQSRRRAEQSALADCQAKGGKNCKLEVSYANGCAAVVAGDHRHNSTDGATLEEAIQRGMKICVADDTNCRAIFTSCSPAAQIE